MAGKKEETRENTCVVCFKEVATYSIGHCDHPVCFECSTRMRVLCRQNECPICRQEMPMVIFTRNIKPFETIKGGNFLLDQKYKISFFSSVEKAAYDELLSHDCPQCKKVSPNFGNLREHVRRVHQLNYCDLCVDNLKILTKERRCYNRQELATHRRNGDPDDRSHRGHPLCEFCDRRYMDNEELYRHLRRDHLFCHFCDADGHHRYYQSYGTLREHYRSDHYLCEEGDCYMEKFTSVFRTDIDLKAHKASAHGKGLGKAELKQARTLDIAFTLAPRRQQRNNRGPLRREDDMEGAVGGSSPEPPPQVEPPVNRQPPPSSQINTNCIEEFPSLGGAANPTPQLAAAAASGASSRKTASSSLRGRGGFTMEDFPALGSGGIAPPAVTTSVTMRVNTERPSPSANPPPQTNLSIQVSSPRFTTTVTSQKAYNLNFPALDGGAAPQAGVSSSASVQWTAKKKQNRESQTPSSQSSTASHIAKSKPIPKMDDFPALEPKNNKPLFPTPPPKISTASNTVKTIQTDEHYGQAKTKKKKSKSKSAVVTNNASTVGTTLKNKQPESGGGEPAAGTFRNAAHERRALLYDGLVETERDVINQVVSNIKMMTEEELMLMKGSASGKENKRDSANKPKIDDSAFPALPGFGPPPGFEAKWAVKKSGSAGSKSKAPPPGLKKPETAVNEEMLSPPGLDLPAPAPPPGFTPVNGSFPSLTSESSYVTPPHFERRNANLVEKISKALGTDALNDFKQVSFAFRNTMLEPVDYYNYCKEIMGNESFISIFPELLALLPEVSKQQDLWPHYKSDKDRFEASTTKGNRLDACATCGQVLRSGDLRDHLTRHSLDNHFPSLDTAGGSKNAWSK